MSPVLPAALLQRLRVDSAGFGFARLGVARLDDPRLEHSRRALSTYDAEGRAGEMDFMTKTIELRQRPERLLPGARTAIVGLVAYDGEPSPIARYAQFFDYHTDVHRRLAAVADLLSREVPGVDTLVCVDTKPVPERALAMIAGLGFIGKNGCLIAPGLGSFVVIGVLLTTADLVEDGATEGVQVEPSRGTPGPPGERMDSPGRADGRVEDTGPWDACGRCRACLDACPTDAFVSPGVLDPRRCVSYLTIEHRSSIREDLLDGIGERVAGCDACQDVCPYNRGVASRMSPMLLPIAAGPSGTVEDVEAGSTAESSPRLEPAPRSREITKLRPHDDARAVPTLAGLATIRNRRYKALVKHSPVDRIPRRTMHRNALIALGNVERPMEDEEQRALVWHLLGADAAFRELAARAWVRRSGEAPPSTEELARCFPAIAEACAKPPEEPSSS